MARVLASTPARKRCGIAVPTRCYMAFSATGDRSLTTRRWFDSVNWSMKRPCVIVIGRPIALSGRDTASTSDADKFFSQVQEHFNGVSVVQWDETPNDA